MRKVLMWLLRAVVALLLAAFLAAGALLGWTFWQAARNLPDYRMAEAGSWQNCVPLGAAYEFLPFEAIPPHAIDAFLAARDPDFLTREAYDPLAELFRRRGTVSARNSLVSVYYIERLLPCQGGKTRRDPSAALQYWLERSVPRRKMLEAVINAIDFGHGVYGIAAASKAYLGRPLDQANLGELAWLAPIPSNPTDHVKDGGLERDYVLERMVRMHAITQSEADAAKREPLRIDKHTAHGKY